MVIFQNCWELRLAAEVGWGRPGPLKITKEKWT